MSISAGEKGRYIREAAIVLDREGFHTDRTHTGGLRVLLDGAPLCEVTENGGITYHNEDIDEPERIVAKDKVYEIVRTTAEYMRQMETAPSLKADGLEDALGDSAANGGGDDPVPNYAFDLAIDIVQCNY